MEQLPGGAARLRSHHRVPPYADRLLGMLQQPQPSAAAPALELSEDDIFSIPLECSSPSPTRRVSNPSPKLGPSASLNRHGILAALNGDIGIRSAPGSNTRPVFNHKASPDTSGLMMIPRPPSIRGDRCRVQRQSATVNIPAMPAALRRRARELNDAVSGGEEEEEEDANGAMLPPHEVVASRHSSMLACSVLEGTGRTLKGRDLRQVRNAIFRKTGFID